MYIAAVAVTTAITLLVGVVAIRVIIILATAIEIL